MILDIIFHTDSKNSEFYEFHSYTYLIGKKNFAILIHSLVN